MQTGGKRVTVPLPWFEAGNAQGYWFEAVPASVPLTAVPMIPVNDWSRATVVVLLGETVELMLVRHARFENFLDIGGNRIPLFRNETERATIYAMRW